MSVRAGVRVTLDTGKLDRRLSAQGFERLQEALAKRVAFDARDYVPVESGTLRDSEAVNSDYEAGLVIWNTPYARRVYNLDSVRTVINPKATSHWCETAKQNHLELWRQFVAAMARTM